MFAGISDDVSHEEGTVPSVPLFLLCGEEARKTVQSFLNLLIAASPESSVDVGADQPPKPEAE